MIKINAIRVLRIDVMYLEKISSKFIWVVCRVPSFNHYLKFFEEIKFFR